MVSGLTKANFFKEFNILNLINQLHEYDEENEAENQQSDEEYEGDNQLDNIRNQIELSDTSEDNEGGNEERN